MREAIRLRYSLSPYIYNAAREAYDTGVCLCRPLYYDYPEAPEAYDCKEEFLFGGQILATAVCEPVNPETGLAPREIWFPEGDDWYDVATGRLYAGGQKRTLHYTLSENPWYVKAGAIIPLADDTISSLQEASNVLRLFVAPGQGESSLCYYEDDGRSQAYVKEFATTRITKQSTATSCTLTVEPREGCYQGMSPLRQLEFVLEGVPVPVSVTVNGEEAPWRYEGKDLALVVSLPERPAGERLVLSCRFPETDPSLLRGKKALMHRMMAYTPVLKDVFNTCVDPYKLLSRPFLKLAQCASHIDADPDGLEGYLRRIDLQEVEEDLMKEAATAETAGKAEAAARIRRALAVIQAQVKDCF